MKTTLMLLGLAIAAPLLAASSDKILLSGDTVTSSADGTKVTGATKAVIGEMTVAADSITLDKAGNTLKCDGAVTIRTAGSVVTASHCVVELSPGEKKPFLLSRGKIRFSPTTETRAFPSAPTDLIGTAADREKAIEDFHFRIQSEKTQIKAEPAP